MRIGTKSILFGAHAFWLHPFVLALAWWRLYGFPWDPRLWVAFLVHDLGYWGKPNMDGKEGEQHPYLGARIMGFLFDWSPWNPRWYLFTLTHSRYLAKHLGREPSRLCMADKLAISLTPSWLYVPMTRLTGEIQEYRARGASGERGGHHIGSDWEWHRHIGRLMHEYAHTHKG